MAFPFLSSSGFEGGAIGYTAEVDTTSILDVAHYTELARAGNAPFRGAYCARLRLNGGTTAAYLREDTSFDTALDAETALRFYVYIGRDFTMAANDKFSLFEAESTLDTTTEIAAGLMNTGGVLQFWTNETIAAASPATYDLGNLLPAGRPGSALGKWFCFGLGVVVDAGGGNDGSITGRVNGVSMTAVATLDQAAIVNVKFGAIGVDAGTRGTILIDEVGYDDLTLNPYTERFPQAFTVTKNEHIFVGPGAIESAALLSTTSTDTMTLWDTDRANVLNGQGFKLELNNSIHSSASGPLVFHQGCYAVLTGTNPRGTVSLMTSSDLPGITGPAHYSEAGIRMLGQSRKG